MSSCLSKQCSPHCSSAQSSLLWLWHREWQTALSPTRLSPYFYPGTQVFCFMPCAVRNWVAEPPSQLDIFEGVLSLVQRGTCCLLSYSGVTICCGLGMVLHNSMLPLRFSKPHTSLSLVWHSKLLTGKQEPQNHSCLQMSRKLSFAPTARIGLLSSGGCGGGPALPQQGWWGLGCAPNLASEKSFEKENPLVSNGINHTWGGNGRVEVQNKGKRWLWLQGFIKASLREKSSTWGKAMLLERESNRGFHFHMFFLVHKAEITQRMLYPSTTSPHMSCWDMSFVVLLCAWTSPRGINPHPFHRHSGWMLCPWSKPKQY